MPKVVGMTPEECVLFAVALDVEIGSETQSPLLRDDIVEVGVSVSSNDLGDVVRILVVTEEQ